MTLATRTASLLATLGVSHDRLTGGDRAVRSPLTGEIIAHVVDTDRAALGEAVARADAAYAQWRAVPAPRRGEFVRLLGEELRAAKRALGELVTIEAGKITSEGLGEVQEMIDICDFAVGLSRQLYGLTIASERADHRMMEQWHPLGPVGIITAFNFPVAVWAWNAALALVCGNPVIWKPSEKTPLTAIAVQALVERVASRFGDAPAHLSSVVIGGREAGEQLVDDARIPLVSATGSTAMGRAVAFAAAGTAGQRCTSLRRLIVHESVHDALVGQLKQAYASLRVGNPLDDANNLVGPLIDEAAFHRMQATLEEARK